MEAVLSIENGVEGGTHFFREVGTEGRSVIRNATRRKILNRAKHMQDRWGGRAVRVEEHDTSIYGPVARTWTYHCRCDLNRPCQFHSERGRA